MDAITNIVAALSFTITTNWTTIGILSPPPRPPGTWQTTEYRPTWTIQSGAIYSNIVALVPWKGVTNIVVLESFKIGGGLERRIDEQTGGSFIWKDLTKERN